MPSYQLAFTVVVTISAIYITYKFLFDSHKTLYNKKLTLEGWDYYKNKGFGYPVPISKTDYVEGKRKEKDVRDKLRNS